MYLAIGQIVIWEIAAENLILEWIDSLKLIRDGD